MKAPLTAAAALALSTVIAPQAAEAGTIDYTGSACHDLTVCVMTIVGGAEDGVTVTIDNPQVEAATPNIFNLGSLVLGSGGLGYSLDVEFSADVLWTGGEIGYSSSNQGFNVLGGLVNETNLLVGATSGPYTLGSGIAFVGGVTYTLSSNNLCAVTECGGIGFATMEFGVADVPLPAAAPLLLAGIAGLAVLRRRRG